MNREPLFFAGISLGRAHILKINNDPSGAEEMRKASAYYNQYEDEKLKELARAAKYRADHWRSSLPHDIEAEIKEAQRVVAYPDQHALNAGLNLGWAVETTRGQMEEDVRHVLKVLNDAQKHVVALAPSQQGQIEHIVNPVKNPIKNLLPQPPRRRGKPHELPQHRGRVEGLQRSLKDHLQ